ncbi:hypothetical protein K490DRAFT_70031 [Saccharata proteae CBS 121410]|uniref:Ras GEF n=1 Tax=Saccharata proteae CBS 121410 TaxID=1314787 RepID=A0A9P4LVP1_9PEZI|nr:hypothetical protein K490DRAFT_70031 [Saccharata proteae CBS 121410]
MPAQHAPRPRDPLPANIIPADGLKAKTAALTPNSRKFHGRLNSLKRAKNSTDQLRQRQRTASISSSSVLRASQDDARAGSRFAVGNVGSNGVIYLRPVAPRAATPRSRPPHQPSFAFPPATPPDNAVIDFRGPRPSNGLHESFPSGSHTPTPTPTPPIAFNPPKKKKHSPPPSKRVNHVRSHSFSTVDDFSISHTGDSNTFKVVIDRPKAARPRTADTADFPVLEVPIPSYRLGTPRFSDRGTAILRSSVYTRTSGTDDFRSSFFSRAAPEYNKLFPVPPGMVPHSHASRRFSDCSQQPYFSRPFAMDRPSTQPSSSQPSSTSLGPQIYDALTTNPDDSAVVRYSPTGEIIAATPSRLIAHITSPSFLDYELLSDFFLTFRSYLSIRQLVDYLIARLRWAVERADDFGRIVRVRTFVALRHWILNYFVDDFVPRFSVRSHFCKLVNELYRDLQTREDGGAGDLKIIGELKKCWRRTCALYWDDEGVIGVDDPDADILPGGKFEEDAPEAPLPQTSRPNTQENVCSRKGKSAGLSLHAGLVLAGTYGTEKQAEAQETSHHLQQQSMASNPFSQNTNDAPLSPGSETSMQVASCSLPLRGFYRAEQPSNSSLHPHPVPARVSINGGISGSMRGRKAGHNHQRSGSFSDALRDHRVRPSLSRKPTAHSEEITIFVPGSLVRGAMYQPDSPYINLKRQSMRAIKSHFDMVLDTCTPPGTAKSNLTVNPGMKKILGSVRRALSNRQAMSSSYNDGTNGDRDGSDTNSMGTSAYAQGGSNSAPGTSRRHHPRERTQMRVDALAARVNDSFQRALSQELEREQQLRHSVNIHQRSEPLGEGHLPSLGRQQSAVTNVTLGSRSIVIMDDTGAPPVPQMSDAVQNHLSSGVPLNMYERGSQFGISGEISDSSRSNVEPLVSLDQMNAQSSASASARNTKQWAASLSRATSGRPSLRPSLLRHSQSMRGSARLSGSMSLRRFASFHSGLIRHKQGISEDLNTVSDVMDRSSANDPFYLDRPPARQLRRRPGGDLRAVDNVHDLEAAPRPISTGSVSNFAHSVANSIAFPRGYTSVMPADVNCERRTGEPEPLLPEVPQSSRRSVSLVATHSSQPNLRPSFEAEVARLAALPDDEDDGGIESALAKLEGKFEKKTPENSPSRETFYIPGDAIEPENTTAPAPSPEIKRAHREEELGEASPPRQTLTQGASIYQMSQSSDPTTLPRQQGHSVIGSESSYSSIPLLERGFSDIAAATRKRLEQTRESARVAPLLPARFRPPMELNAASLNSSLEHVEETDSMRRIPRGGTMPMSPKSPTSPMSINTHKSFLLDDHEDLDDISSAMSTSRSNSAHYSHGVRSFFDDEPAHLEFDDRILPHPLRLPASPRVHSMEKPQSSGQDAPTEFHQGLPTPGLTPTMTHQGLDRLTTRNDSKGIELDTVKPSPFQPQFQPPQQQRPPTAETPRHIPFTLLYDSETLAQQFTLIEKDALDEIDWKELIELRWKQSSPNIRDWVEYLRTTSSHGVDVVIARFNVMVKWALSECVLTESLEERVRCIVKYIHIAAHCRRLRNYATMYQITIALLSTDCARLTRTWDAVPAGEKRTLRELERLVQPLRNFQALRMEMECSRLEEGCVPFVGLYTRDLIYNAQKPAYVGGETAAGPGAEPLVNFERHHTAASIVKNLLRLLEASSRYNFKPVPEVISKCLWMAALDDEEIARRSRELE